MEKNLLSISSEKDGHVEEVDDKPELNARI